MVSESDPDFELLERWRSDEDSDTRTDAGDTLVKRYFGHVQRFFGSSVRDDARQDLVQETFAKLVKAKGGFRGTSSFRTFLFSIARHVLHDYFRARHRDCDPITHSVEDVGESTPSQAIALKQQHDRLVDCMRALPIDTKVMLELYYWQGLTADQLSEIYGIPAGTVRRRIHTARHQVRRCVANESSVVSPSMDAELESRDVAVDDPLESELRAIGRLMALGPTAL